MKVYLVATDTPEGVLYWVGDNDWVYDPVNASWTDDKGLAEMEADQWSDYWAMKVMESRPMSPTFPRRSWNHKRSLNIASAGLRADGVGGMDAHVLRAG